MGWFDDTGYDILTYDHYTVTLGEWTGLCYNFTTRVCVDDSTSKICMADRCVADLNTCLLYNSLDFPPGEVSGVLGLGKPSSVLQWDQTNSFTQQNYL